MNQLIGIWQGKGIARFPTIEPTNYREILTIRPHAADAMIQVEQKTWRIHPDQSESLLYWEFGFIRQLTESSYEWNNTQNNGRTEVLKGDITQDANTMRLDFHSVVFSNDSRMLHSKRLIRMNGDTLAYTMMMATQSQPTSRQHLSAELKRTST